ncbi:hypothetical protein [Geodermatophilus chilensis]|uniref:hypothetical protein n=1 Tax=Geodermatophilus chilensis TaxID=2035835 RepID=UPI000C25EC19|nr:hypothetical protein [Geodermatophilus chilensis]
MSAIELTMDDVDRDPDALHAWLRAHDLEPNRTAPGVVIRDGVITATLYVVDEQGRKVTDRDPYTSEILGVKQETVEVPLREPVPDGLGTVIP